MKILALILPALLVVLPGCITWHEGVPKAHIPPRTAAGTEAQFLFGVGTPFDIYMMRNAIKEHAVFLTEVELGTEPISKTYVRISIRDSSSCYLLSSSFSCPPVERFPILLPLIPLFPLHDERFVSIQYDFYNDGIVSRYGPYKFVRKIFTWYPLLPFVWVNLLVSHDQDAYSGTLQQFILDAHRDGHL